MKIDRVEVGEILDSRGEKTVEVTLSSEGNSFKTQVPSGKSRGSREAVSLGPESAKLVLEAGLEAELIGREFASVSEMDEFLIGYDGTEYKSKMGGDLMLGISISFARAMAHAREVELWELLRAEFFGDVQGVTAPKIFANMINGGAHAKNNLDIQEFQIISTGHEKIADTITDLKDLYRKLGEVFLAKHNETIVPLGDEQGYAPNFANNSEPLGVLTELLNKYDGKERFTLGIDAAASSFFAGQSYKFDGKAMVTDELDNTYKNFFDQFVLLESIEDPFAENDEEGFKSLFKLYGDSKLLIGDDLTVTNQEAIEKYAGNAINGVIIKPNQIGTVTETCNALNTAKKLGVARIISHRSGEVEDPFIIHFAKACGAEGVKIGVPIIKERISKFNELIRVFA